MLSDDALRTIAQAAYTAYFIADRSDQEAPFIAAQTAARRCGADEESADFLAFVLDWYTLTIQQPISTAVLIDEYCRAARANEHDPEAWRAGLIGRARRSRRIVRR